MFLSPKSTNSLFFIILFIILIISVTTATSKGSKPYTFSDEKFNQTHYEYFTPSGDGTIDQLALQLTPDSISDLFSLFNKSGRVMFTRPFKLWQDNLSKNHQDVVASFNSTFDINVYPTPPTNVSGDGLAFVIAPDLSIPSNSFGEWLGLTNATLNGADSNKFVAIELDTVKQDYDPDNNHVGLNINSVQSNKTVSLSDSNITIAPVGEVYWTVWVEYNGSSKILNVYMDKRGESRPSSPVLSQEINLKKYVNQYSYMGFTGSTGTTAELNCILKWDLSVEILPEKKDWTWLKILLGVGIPGVALLLGCLIWLACYLRKRGVDDSVILGALKNLPGMPREFSYKELKEATNNFDEKRKLGQGGFGVVYKGLLVTDKVEVAVKKFSRENIKGTDDFLAELSVINRLRHKHLNRLIGWCHKNRTLVLVYEYMRNGSVEDHLFSETNNLLNWTQRYNIIAGLASALHYLHNEYDQTVVHRDIKPSNILLDSDYNARLGDFGLAQTIEHGRTGTSLVELGGVPGTIGYIAPESFHAGRATRESDVYGFGAVVLEVVCGERPWNKVESLVLVDWVWKLYREGRILEAVDKRVGKDYVDEEVERLLLLGLACCHPTATERPTTQIICQIVSKSTPPPVVPHFKPAFVWTGMEDIMTGTTADSTPIWSSYYGGGSSRSPQCVSKEKRTSPHEASMVVA